MIKGPGSAQTWKTSLEHFQTKLENWEGIRTSFLQAFQGIQELRPKPTPGSLECNDDNDEYSYGEEEDFSQLDRSYHLAKHSKAPPQGSRC